MYHYVLFPLHFRGKSQLWHFFFFFSSLAIIQLPISFIVLSILKLVFITFRNNVNGFWLFDKTWINHFHIAVNWRLSNPWPITTNEKEKKNLTEKNVQAAFFVHVIYWTDGINKKHQIPLEKSIDTKTNYRRLYVCVYVCVVWWWYDWY